MEDMQKTKQNMLNITNINVCNVEKPNMGF